MEKQVAILWVVTNGYLDDVPTPRIREFEQRFYRFLESERPDVLKTLARQARADRRDRHGPARGRPDFKQTFPA